MLGNPNALSTILYIIGKNDKDIIKDNKQETIYIVSSETTRYTGYSIQMI